MKFLRFLHDTVRAILARHFDNLGLVASLAIIVGLSIGIYHLDSASGSLGLDTMQLLALPPVLLFLMLHTAIWCYKNFLRPWWQFLKSEKPKVFEDVLPSYEELTHRTNHPLGHITEMLAYYRLLFFIRCTRTAFSWLPFLVFLYLLLQLVRLSLTLVPR